MFSASEKNKCACGRLESRIFSPLFVIFISFLVLMLEMNMRTTGIGEAFSDFMAQPKLWAVNLFPVLCITGAFTFLFENVFLGGALSSLLFGALSYANLLKIDGRSDPLVPGDIVLLREALNAVGEYRLELYPAKIIPVVIFAALLLFVGIRLKRGKKNGRKAPARIVLLRVSGFLMCIALLAGMVKIYYTDSGRYYRFETPERYNVALEFETLGFNYCFLYNWNLYPVDKPEGFSRAEVESWDSALPADAPEPEVKPNIIIVMGEAFSDLSDEAPFEYAEEHDPLKSYKKLCDSENAVSGHIVVSNYAAGTANTEFNVMTGMQTNMIGSGLTSSFRVVRKPTANIYSVLRGEGYDAFFMHPGKSWFYNRSSVFGRFGISDQVFEEAFDEGDRKGTMISDAAFLEELKKDLETRMLENDAPLFVYSTTIENHQAYNYGKFGDTELPEVPLNVDVQPVSTERLEVYMEGIRDNSDMLLELAEWLDSLQEPSLLVFFGDHRPNLGDTYEDLGLGYMTNTVNDTPEAVIASYLSPFVIRANRAYAEKVDIPALLESLDLADQTYTAGRTLDGPVISDNYIPSILLEITGFTGRDAYFDTLSAFRREVTVYRDNENAYLLADGSYAAEDGAASVYLNDAQREILRKLHWWTYYRIKY